jgi:cell wall-associated NlpC family hydrolase
MKKGENLNVGRALKVPTDTYFHDRKNISTQVASAKKTEKTKVASVEKAKKNKAVSAKKSIKAKNTKLTDYKIQSGDTLFMIARKHHTTIDEVLSANKMKKGENLKVGRALKVPTDTYFPDKKKSETVKLASVAKTEKKIIQKAKKSTSPTKKAASYKVRKGDSFYSIAKKYDTTVNKLKKANKIQSGNSLKVGQVLALPGAKITTKTTVKLAKNDKKAHTPVSKKTASKKVASKKTASKKVAQKPKQKKKSFLSLVSGSKKQKAIPKEAKKYLGKRYVWGATGPYRFDCSGFTSYVCKKNGVCLPRTSVKQSRVGKRVSRRSLKAGDLVFFDTSKRHRGHVNHVGIYIGNNKFIHASSAKKKVVITSLNKPFYKSRFKWGRRL